MKMEAGLKDCWPGHNLSVKKNDIDRLKHIGGKKGPTSPWL